MQKTNIEYLDMTWNPIAMRCTRVSAGCKNCWHLRMANRLGGNEALPERDRNAYNLGIPWLRDKELSAPLRRKKPARIGVNFMGDIFHEFVTNEQIAAVYGVMAASPQHQFCVLTKRPDRAAEWYQWLLTAPVDGAKEIRACLTAMDMQIHGRSFPYPKPGPRGHYPPWPLPNVWLGVSVEDQATIEKRWDDCFEIPAAKHFVSYEPALGPINAEWLMSIFHCPDLVICGAETGHGKRQMDLDWARSVRDQCQAAGVPFFFKQDSDGSRTIDGRRWEEAP